MAIRDISQLKAWFRRGLYPTEGQFADLIDSFRHRLERVALTDVEGLADALNRKYDISSATGLDTRLKRLEELLPADAGGRPPIMFFDGLTYYAGDLPTQSSSASKGKVLFAVRKGGFVFAPDNAGISAHPYYPSWQEVRLYNDAGYMCRGRQECIFVMRGSCRMYTCVDGMLVRLDSGGTLEFYEVDDFNSPDYSHLIGGTIKLRIDCRDNTSDLGLSGSPEEVLYTVDDCIVYDRATAGFVHRRITRGELPNIYPPTIGVVRVEFRNRWLGCGEWGELDDMGAVPGDRVYCCAKTNQLYTYHNDYVNGGRIFEALLQSDPLTIDEARKLVDSIFK